MEAVEPAQLCSQKLGHLFSCTRMAMLLLVALVLCSGAISGEYTDPHCGGKTVIVHLFEWKWTDIALECETYLSKKGFCGVQVSPANEHVELPPSHQQPCPWWERYQPVSYKLKSRSGTEAEFADMVKRCKAVGVRIYVDVVLNHMAGLGRTGVGSAGTHFNSDNFDFPGVPYTKTNFHPMCTIKNYGDADEVRNCYLVGLTDLDQSQQYVRDKITGFLNALIDHGVAGFRVDASKHMMPQDLAAIQSKVKDLPEGGRPFFVHEVIDQSNEPIKTSDYTSLGYVTEFRYCVKMKEGIDGFGRLAGVVDYGWGMTVSDHAFVFVDNHDNERGHGGGGNIITFEHPKEYKMAVAFLLANDYGFARVMSSYEFGDNNDLGPPHSADCSTKNVPINADGVSCGDGWVCEHRWRPVANMVAFRNAVAGTQKQNYYESGNVEVAFSRGNKGFFAMAKNGHMDKTLQTGLPAGDYYDLISDCKQKITVDGSGMAHIVINNDQEPIVAFLVAGCPSSGSGTGTGGGSHTGSGTNTQPINTQPVTTAGPTGPLPTAPAGWARTVIFVEKQTQAGQDLFISGGLDHSRASGCSSGDLANNPCAIPIKARDMGSGTHFTKHNDWAVGDNYLDWYGAEPGQGSYNGQQAQGTPAVWTTNSAGSPGYNALNTYGDHYWMVDVDMDCSKTFHGSGWFELKALVAGHWESDIHGPMTCQGGGPSPGATNNHWAVCGKINVYHFSSSTCEIKAFPSSVALVG